jgi:hypothetical protein
MNLRLLLCATALVVGPRAAAAQDWPRYGRDGALTGRSPARGAMAAPHLAWSYALAGRELLVALQAAPAGHRLALDAAAGPGTGSPPLAPAGPLQLDVEGRGTLRPAVETFHERWAKILSGVAGYQRVAWNHTWTDQAVCRLQLFAHDRGA